jgi:hypothetical protein
MGVAPIMKSSKGNRKPWDRREKRKENKTEKSGLDLTTFF